MLSDQIELLLKRGESLRTARRPLESVWDDVAYFFGAPEGITERRAPGTERDPLEDSATIQAWRGFALSLGGLLRPRGQKWLKPSFANDELNENEMVKLWREVVGDRMMSAINAIETRSAPSLRQCDEMLTLYGVGYLFLDEDIKRSRLRFRNFHVRDCYHDVDENGIVNTVFRYFHYTASEAVSEFGQENLHRDVLDDLRNGGKKKWKFVHVTLPSDAKPKHNIKTNLPVASIHIDISNKHVVREGGFHEFPWIVPRDAVPAGWRYGYSLCMANLPDARTVQSIAAAISDASEYSLSPPLLADDAALIGEISLQPDGVTYYDSSRLQGNRAPVERLDIGGNVPVGLEEQREKREALFRGFLADVLNLPLQSGMSVPEIIRRNEDFARMIAPITDPLLPDYNGALGERVFGIMLRANQFPGGAEGPTELQGYDIKWEYENPISRAEKEIDLNRGKQAVAEALEVAAVDPEVLDEVDLPKMVRHNMTEQGASEFLRDPQEVAQRRQQRAQAQQLADLPGQAIEASEAVLAADEAGQVLQQ